MRRARYGCDLCPIQITRPGTRAEHCFGRPSKEETIRISFECGRCAPCHCTAGSDPRHTRNVWFESKVWSELQAEAES